MAITGETYCTSAWNGFVINLKHNEEQYFAINSALFIIDSFSLCVFLLTIVAYFVSTGVMINDNNDTELYEYSNDSS